MSKKYGYFATKAAIESTQSKTCVNRMIEQTGGARNIDDNATVIDPKKEWEESKDADKN